MNKNTFQSTNNWVKVWKTWPAQKGYDESIENRRPWMPLNKILEQFYATVLKDGDKYEPVSLMRWLLLSKDTSQRKNTNIGKFLKEKPGYGDNRAKASDRTRQEVWQQPRKMRCGKKEAGKGKSASSRPNGLVAPDPIKLAFEVVRNTTAWRSNISPVDWVNENNTV